MAKLTLADIESLANSASAKQAINDNNTAIEAAIENSLSRNGASPNAMEADLDMGDHKVLNVKDPVAGADAVNLRSVRPLVDFYAGEIAKTIIEGTLRVERFVATSGQTTFTLLDSPGTPENALVFDSGHLMTPGIDYTLSGSTLKDIVFFTGRTLDSEVIIRYVQLSPADSVLRGDLLAANTVKGANLVTMLHPDPLALGQPVARFLTNAPSPTWYASDAQLAVDATDATQKAIDYAISSGRKAVYFPGGRTYKYPATSPALNPGDGDMTFYGDGKHTSIIKYDEGTASGDITTRKNLFHNFTGTEKGKLEFRGLQFNGMWSESGYATTFSGGTVMLLKGYEEVTLRDCLFTNLRSYVTSSENSKRVLIQGCQFFKNGRDLFRFRSTPNQLVINNHFKHNDDDAIALHSNTSDTGGAIREGIIVHGNILEDTGGIKVLAGRMVDIGNNLLTRTKQYGIAVYSDAGSAAAEANSQIFGVSIHDNHIYDHLPDYNSGFGSGGVSGVILVYSREPEAGTDSNSVVPGTNITSSGTFNVPYSSRDSTYTSATNGVAPMYGVRIQNNTIMRTQRAVAAYSQWGKGLVYAGNGPNDPAVTDANLRPSSGIIMGGQVRKALITGNHISYVGSSILFDAITSNFGADMVLIANNQFTEFTGAAVAFTNPAAVRGVRVVIDSNMIDGDPYQVHDNRSVNGGWSADTTPAVLSQVSHHGIVVSNNKIRNIARVATNTSNITFWNNTLYSDPAGVNFNSSSRGIGNNPAAGPGFNYQIVDSNPTSANFGQVNTVQLKESFGMPSAGEYVQGAFVQNTNPALNVFGWLRVTTGSGHVAGTDWKQVVIS